MLAVLTLGGIAHEQGVTKVTVPTNPHANRLADEILPTGLRRDGKDNLLPLLLRVRLGLASAGHSGGAGSTASSSTSPSTAGRRTRRIVSLGRRVAEAFLASDMMAAGAQVVGSELGQAAVAVAADSHADGLIGPLDVVVDGAGHPFVRLQRQAILFEKSAGSFLLHFVPALGGDASWSVLAFGGLGWGLCWPCTIRTSVRRKLEENI